MAERRLPDIVCLQELKTTDDKFPRKELERAGYGAIWHGQKSWNGVAILSKGVMPIMTRRGLPGDPDDAHSRYIEAAVSGMLIGCLYLPNGNPAPGPKFDYKLRWFRRLHDYAAELLDLELPAILVGDFNVMPTDMDVYAPERWRQRRAVPPGGPQGLCRSRRAGDGQTPSDTFILDERIYTFWKYWRIPSSAMPAFASTISFFSAVAAPWHPVCQRPHAPRSIGPHERSRPRHDRDRCA